MGAVTGKGLAALIREKFSLKVTAFAMLALLVANFGTTTAEFSGVAAAFSLAHVPAWAAVPPVAFGVWLLVTRGSYRKVERVFLALTAVYVAYFVAGFLAKPDWGAARPRHRRPAGADEQPLDPHRDRRHRHHDHAVGPVLHPGLHRRQAHLDRALRLHQGRGVHGRRLHRRDRPLHRPRLRGHAVQGRHRRRDGVGRRQGARSARRAGGRPSSSASGCSTSRSWAPRSCRSRPPTPSARRSASRAAWTRSSTRRRPSTAC